MEPVETVTVEVPFTIRKRGGRKQVITPDGASAWVSPRTRIDSTMIKAIARGFPLAEAPGNRGPRDYRGDRGGGEDQLVLCEPVATDDASGAAYRRGDSRWTAAGGDDAGGADGAVPSELDKTASLTG